MSDYKMDGQDKVVAIGLTLVALIIIAITVCVTIVNLKGPDDEAPRIMEVNGKQVVCTLEYLDKNNPKAASYSKEWDCD